MALKNTNPTTTTTWQKLTKHFDSMQLVSMPKMFEDDKDRAAKFHIKWNDFLHHGNTLP